MPRYKETTITNNNSVDLTSNFTSTAAGGANYSYSQSSNLRMFLRFSTSVTNLATFPSNDTITIVYESPGNLVQKSERVGARTLSGFFADNTTNKNGEVLVTFSGTNAPLDNITTFGDGSSDSPFSFSLWVKYESTPSSGDLVLVEKGRTGGGNDEEYRLMYNDAGNKIKFNLFDDSSTRTISKQWGSIDLNDNTWHHITITYDGHGSGAHNDQHITCYLDGVDQESNKSAATDNGYTAMEPASDELHIGSSKNHDSEAQAFLAEFAIWGAELSSNDVKAIYYAQFDALETTIEYNSGYTNLSPRIQQRSLDNRPGCYPTKHRMGDSDRSGKNNIFYEDLPLQFGNCIKDDFTDIDLNDLITTDTGFDSSKWVVSSGMTIRREAKIEEGDAEIIDRAATFSGAGTSGKRFLRTKNKVRNITRMYFELIQGPYNISAILLNLRTGNPSETLKVQISTDEAFTSPITVATYTPDPVFGQFFGEEYQVDTPPRKRVTLTSNDFPDPGESYYLRFVQETFVASHKYVWAIPNVKIEYANQNLQYPLLLNHGHGHDKYVSASLVTPHKEPDLSGVGRLVKGISDQRNPFQDFSETISAFNDEHVVEDESVQFFNQGTNPDVYPGFSSPINAKTKFIIDLSPSEETKIGYINPTTSTESTNFLGNDTSNIGQPLMCYWNESIKRWEKVGKNVSSNNRADSSLSTLKALLTSSCVGFGPLGQLGRSPDPVGSGPAKRNFGINELDAPESLQLFNKPITQFSFPFGSQYHATSSQYILAKDIGITKPFLLEKCTLKYESRFEIVKSGSYGESETDVNGGTHSLFKPQASSNETQLADNALYIITPSFFMLRQFNDDYINQLNVPYRTGMGMATQGSLQITREIPKINFELDQGTHNSTNIYENREMITYGQTRLFITSSDAFRTDHNTEFNSSISIGEMIDNGLSADLNIVRTHTINPAGGYGPTGESESAIHLPLTESLTMNFPCRNIGQYNDGSGLLIGLSNIITNQGNISVGKTKSTRSDSNTKSNRAIVNGFAAVESKDVERVISPVAPLIPGTTLGLAQIGTPTFESLDRDSPYLILPSDKLVFGWQYPISDRHGEMPGTDSQSFFSMTFFGNSKLYLYGSEVVENKEFHETVNQNLTSCGVYEHIIGDEKVIDQWQVAYRGELTGSFISNQTFNYQTPGVPDSAYRFVFGNNLVSENILGDPLLKPNSIDPKKHNKPLKRIGLSVMSITGNDRQKFINRLVSAGSSESDAIVITDDFIRIYLAAGTLKNMSFFPEGLEYVDGNKSLGSFYDGNHSNLYDPRVSSYGVMIRRSTQGLGVFLNRRASEFFKGQGPKYNFNTKHFGHYADMFRQGLDSKFEVTPRQGFTTGYDIVVNSQPPVKALFVEKSVEENGKINYEEKPIDYFTNFFYFQSSNLNQFMTSSMPFIDDDTARNRSYIATEFIGFNAISPLDLLS